MLVQWYSSGGASLHPHLIHVSLGPRPSLPPKRHFDRFINYCTAAHGRVSLYMPCHADVSFPFIFAPSYGRSGPHLVDRFLSTPQKAQTASQSVQRFFCTAHGTASVYYSTAARPLPPKMLTDVTERMFAVLCVNCGPYRLL